MPWNGPSSEPARWKPMIDLPESCGMQVFDVRQTSVCRSVAQAASLCIARNYRLAACSTTNAKLKFVGPKSMNLGFRNFFPRVQKIKVATEFSLRDMRCIQGAETTFVPRLGGLPSCTSREQFR